ncbi:Heme chaperone HemW [Sporomusa rhizae]|uniref:radical SAM family heme chaperone HemW n=1 Tax=Sporomusa rhizae TaxID=357999 RepID=UPI00352B1D0C
MSKLGLYVHIPFCKQKCLYCDFSSYTGLEHLFVAYTTALCQQIAEQGGMLCKPVVDTVYIGGGTPSLLPAESMEQILRSLYSSFTIEDKAEISMEANPGTVTLTQLARLKTAGINRVSFGVQSFNNELLRRLGRIHTLYDSMTALEYAQAVGFNTISIDLMYGLPGQTLSGFAADLKQAAALPIQHISVYGLKLEEETPLALAYERGELELPDETEEEAMYDLMTSFLPAQGLFRYEISNFAFTGRECRHNLKYWRYQPYLGLGCAAHSFSHGQRISSTASVQEYISAIAGGRSPIVMRDILTPGQSMAEYIFLALRTTRGMVVCDFSQQFETDFFEHFGITCEKLENQSLIATDKKQVWLTEKGMKFGNIVFRSFLPD